MFVKLCDRRALDWSINVALEDFIEPEVGWAVALTAAVASPAVRKVLRKGAVYGLAGILMAGDAVSTLAQGVKRGVQQASPVDMPEAAAEEAPLMAPEVLNTSVLNTGSDGTLSNASSEATVPASQAAPKRVRKTAEVSGNE